MGIWTKLGRSEYEAAPGLGPDPRGRLRSNGMKSPSPTAASRTLTLASWIERSEDVAVCGLGAETILLKLDPGFYYGLDDVGTTVWASLEQPSSLRSILTQIVETYEVSPAECEGDLLDLVGNMISNGLVRLHRED